VNPFVKRSLRRNYRFGTKNKFFLGFDLISPIVSALQCLSASQPSKAAGVMIVSFLLKAINPMGREIALRRGANVLMPILTPTKYREHYQLYEGKPCITDTAAECRRWLRCRDHSVRRPFWMCLVIPARTYATSHDPRPSIPTSAAEL
jgi:hypothetical protein